MPIVTIGKMLRHNNIQSTQVYAPVTQKKLFEDMDRIIEAVKDFKLVFNTAGEKDLPPAVLNFLRF